ncbi:SDR family NAD(P)-dependent oxidoreductase [Streptomyces sp. NPDC018584]|uniref:SDR family NAD(P)-dependent oxidoreductase n=1 Tax=unclassified Streptomyces TaxID=2593676 RepID=UPI0037A5D6A8
MGELADKTALVTGGSRGIGRAVAVRLAADGALVAVHYGGKGVVNRLFHAVGGQRERAGLRGYTVTKAAPAALGPSLANDLGRRGITVNTVEPGVVLTDMNAHHAEVPEAVARLEAITALGRIGGPADVADAVALPVGPQGRWMTGQAIDISGGTCLGPIAAG